MQQEQRISPFVQPTLPEARRGSSASLIMAEGTMYAGSLACAAASSAASSAVSGVTYATSNAVGMLASCIEIAVDQSLLRCYFTGKGTHTVKCSETAAWTRLQHGNSVLHAIHRCKHRLNLAQLQAEAAQLHLGVCSPNIPAQRSKKTDEMANMSVLHKQCRVLAQSR